MNSQDLDVMYVQNPALGAFYYATQILAKYDR